MHFAVYLRFVRYMRDGGVMCGPRFAQRLAVCETLELQAAATLLPAYAVRSEHLSIKIVSCDPYGCWDAVLDRSGAMSICVMRTALPAVRALCSFTGATPAPCG